MTQTRDFRSLLQSEFEKRRASNPRYSLRSFARALKLEPAFLWKILHDQRKITPATVTRASQALRLSAPEVEQYRAACAKPAARASADRYRSLSLDHFTVISDWCHYAILELLTVKGFRPEFGWVARSLGIPAREAQEAVERLGRVGLLKIDAEGGWTNASGDHTTVGNEFTAEAFRRLQRQVLKKALDALESVPMEERDQSSMTLAIDSRRMPEAKQRIRKFRRELTRWLQSGGERDSVFHLGISLYPISGKSGAASGETRGERENAKL